MELEAKFLIKINPKQDVFVKHKCPQILANSKDGQGHKDKYVDTSRKILSQDMLMGNMKALIFII